MMQIPKDKSKRRRREKLKEKNCQFPISEEGVCGQIFYGTGKSKYCPEHRKRKYRAIIDKRSKRNKNVVTTEDSGNQYIEHNYDNPQACIFPCACDGCYNEFNVTVLPNQKVYPKYCPDHRNTYKRKLFLDKLREYEESKMQNEVMSELRETGTNGVLLDYDSDYVEDADTK